MPDAARGMGRFCGCTIQGIIDMTTLITVSNSSGVVGRCDAKCHDAAHPKCDCICGGANHGVGLNQAKTNTRGMALDQVEAAIGKDARAQFEQAVLQPALL